MTSNAELRAFVRESNRIEGILRPPRKREIEATETFLVSRQPAIAEVVSLVRAYQPDAVLRDREGLNVRVGNHIAPEGGQAIAYELRNILDAMPTTDPWDLHVRYETLHPFTDGNGRSGRALWAWQMIRRSDHGLALGFLHRFYYQTLERSR